MKAKLINWTSPDIQGDLESFRPEESDCFGFLLDLEIGPENGGGSELFSVTVCTPRWFAQQYLKFDTDMILGRHFLFVREYNHDQIIGWIQSYLCNNCVGEDGKDVADKISRLGHWEFEDYQQ